MRRHLQQSNAAAFRWPALWGFALAAACSSSPPTSTFLTRDDLLDPTACQGCHQDHYEEWAGSMHAYAADDPVFIAMNQRGQRETNGALGSFCVNCLHRLGPLFLLSSTGHGIASVIYNPFRPVRHNCQS